MPILILMDLEKTFLNFFIIWLIQYLFFLSELFGLILSVLKKTNVIRMESSL